MSAMDEQFVADLIERVRSRFFGKYRGAVTAVDAATLRIKAKVPAVLGVTETGWCMPCVPYAGDGAGIAFLPEEGAGVWIEFEAGDVSYPIWTGCYWREGEVPREATPTVKSVITKGGAMLLLDDGSKTVTLTDKADNKITLSSSGITLERGTQKVVISDAKVDINNGGIEVI